MTELLDNKISEEIDENIRDTPKHDRPRSRGGLKALAVIIAMLALVGSVVSVAVWFSGNLAKQAGVNGRRLDDAALVKRYQGNILDQPPFVIGEMLMRDSAQQVDIKPFLEHSPWSTLRWSMVLRLLSYAVVIVGAALTLMSRSLGPRLMMVGSLVLVIHGLVEGLALLEHGQSLTAEFYRDLKSSYLDVIERARIEADFRQPFRYFRELEPTTLKLIATAYFLVTTVLWQLAAICLAACRPLEPKKVPVAAAVEEAS